jgi:hypothetical protein
VDGDNTTGPNEIRGHFGQGGIYTLIVDQESGEYIFNVTAVATAALAAGTALRSESADDADAGPLN